MKSIHENFVMKLGSSNCQIGLAGEELPYVSFPSKIGFLTENFISPNYTPNNSKFYIAQETESNFGFLSIFPIIKNGLVENWDYYEKLINFIYSKILHIDSENVNTLLIESPFVPNKECQKKAEIFFEKFNLNGICYTDKGVCTLYDRGQYNGMIHGSGENISYFYPVFDGFPLMKGMKKENFGGKNITEYLYNLLQKKVIFGFHESEIMEIIKDIKEKCCYISSNYKNELNIVDEISYKLPDGNIINLEQERIQCCECLFTPGMFGNLKMGFGLKLFDVINMMEFNIKKNLLSNIFLSGRNTLLKGYADRIFNEIKDYAPIGYKRIVRVSLSGENSCWIGGSILGSLSTFDKDYLITKKEYLEYGYEIINKKRNVTKIVDKGKFF